MNGERHVQRSILSWIQHGHELEIEGVFVGRLDGNAHREPDLEIVSDADGIAVDVRHEREEHAEVAAEAVLMVLRFRRTGTGGTSVLV